MSTKLELIHVKDQDSYNSIWINGVREIHSSDNLLSEDILHMIEKFVNENNGITEMNVYTFQLYDVWTVDIPKNVHTVEDLKKWHLESTGEEIVTGW